MLLILKWIWFYFFNWYAKWRSLTFSSLKNLYFFYWCSLECFKWVSNRIRSSVLGWKLYVGVACQRGIDAEEFQSLIELKPSWFTFFCVILLADFIISEWDLKLHFYFFFPVFPMLYVSSMCLVLRKMALLRVLSG